MYKIGDKVTIVAVVTIMEEAMPFGRNREPHVEAKIGSLPESMYPVYMLEEADLKVKFAKIEKEIGKIQEEHRISPLGNPMFDVFYMFKKEFGIE